MSPEDRAGKLLKVVASLLNYEPWQGANGQTDFNRTMQESNGRQGQACFNRAMPTDPNYQAAFDEIRAWMYEVEDEMTAKHWHSSVVGLAELRGIIEGYEGAAKIADEVGIDSEEGREIARRIRARAEEAK